MCLANNDQKKYTNIQMCPNRRDNSVNVAKVIVKKKIEGEEKYNKYKNQHLFFFFSGNVLYLTHFLEVRGDGGGGRGGGRRRRRRQQQQ